MGPDQVTSSLPPGFTGEYPANSTTWEIETVRPTPAQVGTSRFRHLRQNLPFSRFMLALQELGKLEQKHHSLLVRTAVKVNHLHANSQLASSPYQHASRMDICSWTTDVWR